MALRQPRLLAWPLSRPACEGRVAHGMLCNVIEQESAEPAARPVAVIARLFPLLPEPFDAVD